MGRSGLTVAWRGTRGLTAGWLTVSELIKSLLSRLQTMSNEEIELITKG